MAPDRPELRGDGREVIDAALHLIDEELNIAERLERKAREQWQLVAFVAPIAIGAAITAVNTAKDVPASWIIAIGVLAFITVGILVFAMVAASKMSNVRKEAGFNPDVLDAYINDLSDRREVEPAFDQVRADMARTLVEIARARATSNDTRRKQLKSATALSRATFAGSVVVLVVAVLAVVVNA